MKKILKIIGKFIPIHVKKQLKSWNTLAFRYSQYNTIRNNECTDKDGNNIPWYTYPTIEFLNNLDFSQKFVFEFGSGSSSIYWSKKSKSVISVEHDKKWFEKIKSKLHDNQILLLRENNEEYENSILSFENKFDVVIIDGIRRIQCSKIIQNCLNYDSEEGCMIILDNSDWYNNIAKFFRENLNLIQIDFHGFGPINAYTWTTSIFLSRNFNFKPINGVQPHYSISAIQQEGA